jgi:crotonobetainyl-CoA:carnitine CoA-transferase CaiB-like acyl-CoA transferase
MAAPTLFKGMNMVQFCADDLGIVPTMGDVSIDRVPLFTEVISELSGDGGASPSLAMDAVLRRRTRAEWLEAMWEVGMPTVPVASQLGEALSDPQVLANDYAIAVQDPQWGATVQAGHPLLVDPPLAVRSPAPRLGEHTRAVLGSERWQAREPSPATSGARPALPLEGLKVLDFGMFLAGPFGPQLMADLGADVVKVEAPTGDRLRGADRVFAGCQRGKRSVAIDLRVPESRPVLERLVQWADVVHHNLRMPPARLLGLGPEDVRAMNPSVIYCHVSSFGPAGPRRDWPGVDPTSQAVVGWMQEGAGPGNPARWYRIGMTDDQCAISSVIAVLLALRRRAETGEGMDVRASILGTAVLTTSETLLLPDGSIAPYPRMDDDQTGIGPGYRIYEGADGWVAVAALDDATRARLRAVAGAATDDAIEAGVRTRAVDELLGALAGAQVPAERVQVAHEEAFFDSELNRSLGMTAAYEHPVYGHTEQIGAPLQFDDLGVRTDRAVPVLGQHTAEVLAEVGVDADTIAQLARSGVLVGA